MGMYFSRRKETQPSPPSPAFTWIWASSTNMVGKRVRDADNGRGGRAQMARSDGREVPVGATCVRWIDFAVARPVGSVADVDLAALELDLAVA